MDPSPATRTVGQDEAFSLHARFTNQPKAFLHEKGNRTHAQPTRPFTKITKGGFAMTPFHKYMLLEFKCTQGFYALGQDYSWYTLKVLVVKWWGLYKRVRLFEVKVPLEVNANEFYTPKIGKWNYEIKTIKQ